MIFSLICLFLLIFGEEQNMMGQPLDNQTANSNVFYINAYRGGQVEGLWRCKASGWLGAKHLSHKGLCILAMEKSVLSDKLELVSGWQARAGVTLRKVGAIH